MRYTLYSSNCTLCSVVKRTLENANIAFSLVEIDDEIREHLIARGHRAMPVLRDDVTGIEYSGHDCIEAVHSGEIL